MSWGPRAQSNYRARKMATRAIMHEARRRSPQSSVPPSNKKSSAVSAPQTTERQENISPAAQSGPYFADRPDDDLLRNDRRYAQVSRAVFLVTTAAAFLCALLEPIQKEFFLVRQVCLVALIPEGLVAAIYHSQYKCVAQKHQEQQQIEEAAILESRAREQLRQAAEQSRRDADQVVENLRRAAEAEVRQRQENIKRASRVIQAFRNPAKVPCVSAPIPIFVGEKCFYTIAGRMRNDGSCEAGHDATGHIYITDERFAFVDAKQKLSVRLSLIASVHSVEPSGFAIKADGAVQAKVFFTEYPLETLAYLIGALFLCGHTPIVDPLFMEDIQAAANL